MAIKNLLRRCLDRDAKTRLRDIGEARVVIGKFLAEPEGGTEVPRQARAHPTWIAWAGAGVLTALAVVGWLRPRESATSGADLVLSIAPRDRTLESVGELRAAPLISPDGSAVIFDGPSGVQLRRLNALDQEAVHASNFNPGFWSADSKTYVFADGDSLKRLRVPDGAVELISKGVVGPLLGGSVSDSGTILFEADRADAALFMVSTAVRDIKPVEVAGLPQGGFFWPEFLPGSEDFLFLHQPVSDERGIYLGTLRDGKGLDPVPLMKNETAAHYTPAGGGRLLFVRDDNLYAQKLNRTARKLEGEAEIIQRGVGSSPTFFRADFSVSQSGVLAWRPGKAGLSQVTILDRQGKTVGTAGPLTLVQTLRLAPDETRLLLGYFGTAWLLEPGQPGHLRLEEESWNTLWSPDGSKFLNAIPGAKGARLVEHVVTGGAGRDVATPPGLQQPLDISPDGSTLLFNRGAMDTGVFSARLDGAKEEPRSLVPTGETVSFTTFAPDGRWIVYQARGPGSEGIYVQPFPGPGLRRTQIASSGNYPVWRKDGREIVYLDQYQGPGLHLVGSRGSGVIHVRMGWAKQ